MMPKLEKLKKDELKGLEDAFHLGVPPDLRKDIWSILVPNSQNITEKMFQMFWANANVLEAEVSKDHNGESEPIFRESYTTIIKDLNRTYAEHPWFKEGDKWHVPVKNVLMAFSLYRPDIGYVQGLNYIAANIYYYVKNEFQTFVILANLLLRETMLTTFYQFDMENVQIVFDTYLTLMKAKMPHFYEVHESHFIQCSMYLFEYVISLYSNNVDFEMSSRLWDNILFHGEYYVIKVALAIC